MFFQEKAGKKPSFMVYMKDGFYDGNTGYSTSSIHIGSLPVIASLVQVLFEPDQSCHHRDKHHHYRIQRLVPG